MTEPNTSTTAYDPETATNLFDQVEAAYRRLPDYREMYRTWSQTFRKCLFLKTNETHVTFATGDFARTDYLLKEHGATRVLAHRINETRRRLGEWQRLSETTLRLAHRTDLRNLSEFIGFLYQSKVPLSLQALYPTEQEFKPLPALLGEYLRVIVETWDDTYIFVHADTNPEEDLTRVRYDRCGHFFRPTTEEQDQTQDWTYLKELFYVGAQLNLLRPREEDGVLYPEMIIFEPDYLVNISTVAHCFTNYADSPLVDLTKKLAPAPKSSAILLGNLAGQLLDESIQQTNVASTYQESIKEFFHNYAIDLATTPLQANFHSEAQIQKLHIDRVMHRDLPNAVKHFDPKEGIVEPTFFSEMLGLQGRMDFLQLDYKVLLEQKSGSGKFPCGNYQTPKQTDEHYVQLLLYALLIKYNYREQYEKNKGELHTFLLYSKYEESLLDLGAAPELIFRAIKVRNELAYKELHYAQPEGYHLLDELTADSFNEKKTHDTLWERFQRPQIEQVLAPIHQASELEKAYYLRMLNFIANEHVLSKLGNQTKESSGFASTWQDSLLEKRQAGNIYDCLELISPDEESQGSIEHVQLRFAETADNDMSNFRVGDIVILYPYDKEAEPDARRTMVLRCTIEDIQTDSITLQLRAAQSDNRFFVRQRERLWAIEHDFMEASYSSLYRGIHAFLSAPKSRRDLLLLQRKPEVDRSLSLRGDYGAFNDLALHVRQAQELFLIIGPPGTGKTSFGMLNTVQEELLDPDSTLLLMSFTNRAVDEICGKLKEAGIDFLRIGNTASCPKEYADYLLCNRAQQCERLSDIQQLLDQTRILVGTTTSLSSHIALIQSKSFSLAVIDEASQILEPHLLGLLSAVNEETGEPAIRKIVMIGDHKQLPAVVQQRPEVSKVQEPLLNQIHLTDCRLSLFERLLRQYEGNPEVVYMLKRQGRMHPDVALFPNIAFYADQLQVAGRPHQLQCLEMPSTSSGNGLTDLLKMRRFAFVAADAPTDSPSDKVNQTEADMISALAHEIYILEGETAFQPLHTLGIIVPYRNQIATIRNTFDKWGIAALHDITIDTVERYQGSQRKYIIYGFTVQQYYQLEFLTSHVFVDTDGGIVDRKLNVAMTRAMEHLILVGNPKLLANNYTFYKLLAFAREQKCFFDVPTDCFLRGDFEVAPILPSTPKERRASDYELPDALQAAFEQWVLKPLAKASGENWPDRPLGQEDAVNLDAIGYGRCDFAESGEEPNSLSAQEKVLLYTYYYMLPHYRESVGLLESMRPWMTKLIDEAKGAVRFFDFGCGPAIGGLAWHESYGTSSSRWTYMGIDASAEMRQMGKRLWESVDGKEVTARWESDFGALDKAIGEDVDKQSALVVLYFSYFFANVSTRSAEALAKQLCALMYRHSSVRYILVVQQATTDADLNAYVVFRRIVSQQMHVVELSAEGLIEENSNLPFHEVFSS